MRSVLAPLVPNGDAGPGPRATRAEELRFQIADEITRAACCRPAPRWTRPRSPPVSARLPHPVREAIRELAASGLVDTRPHRGAVVARPSVERLQAMFDVMAELEALCAGLCALKMNPAERRAFEVLHAEMGDLMRTGDFPGYREANETFHTSIYAGSYNGYLAEITARHKAPALAVPPRAVPRAGPARALPHRA